MLQTPSQQLASKGMLRHRLHEGIHARAHHASGFPCAT